MHVIALSKLYFTPEIIFGSVPIPRRDYLENYFRQTLFTVQAICCTHRHKQPYTGYIQPSREDFCSSSYRLASLVRTFFSPSSTRSSKNGITALTDSPLPYLTIEERVAYIGSTESELINELRGVLACYFCLPGLKTRSVSGEYNEWGRK